IERVCIAIEDTRADWRKQPLMAAERKKIDGELRQIERESADPLDRVEVKQHAALATELGCRGKVVAKPVRELHSAQRDETCPRVNRFRDGSDRNTPVLRLNPANRYTKLCQPHPAIDVGRVLEPRQHDVISFAPIEPVRNRY